MQFTTKDTKDTKVRCRTSYTPYAPLPGFPNLRGQVPLIAERIGDAGEPVAKRLVCRLADRRRARGERALVHCVDVLHVQIEPRRYRLIWAMRLAHLDHRVADRDLRVMDD